MIRRLPFALPLVLPHAVALAASLAAPLAAPSRARAAEASASPQAALQTAVAIGDFKGILGARARFEAAAGADAKAAGPRYWAALCAWRALPLVWEDKAQAKRLLEDGMRRVDEAIRLDPKGGGAYALKAGLQDMGIGLDPGSMMTLGPAAEADLERARSLAPKDPRVWLFDGIHTLNKPEAFGGGAEAALERFAQAQALFDSLPGGTGAEAWGRADAHVWAGRAQMSRKDYAAAIAQFRRALEIDSTYRWVSQTLLPRAEAALKEAGAK